MTTYVITQKDAWVFYKKMIIVRILGQKKKISENNG